MTERIPETAAIWHGFDVAVILPCYNESATIAGVIAAFQAALDGATIHVFDNNSSDDTADVARRAGARVVTERRQGKGHVVRRMFAEIDADIYVMADGDGTYDAAAAPQLVATLIADRLDMVVGTRAGVTEDAGRRGHAVGNRLFNGLYAGMFGQDYSDIFSGYRVFTRRFAKSFPAVSRGFEIETEMSVHASQLMLPVAEIPCAYGVRREGSLSKLRTFRDGGRILLTFVMLLKEVRPAIFYAYVSTLLLALTAGLGGPLVAEFLATGLVPRLPTAVLAASTGILAGLAMMCGVILDSLTRARIEQKRFAYLSHRPLPIQ
ncbi:MAG: glycosyltransferase [Pseudomonadota bacterium]